MTSAPLEARPRLALVFGYVHFALLLGIVFLATGLKKSIPEPLEPLANSTALALAAGTALFVAADAVLLRVLRIAQTPARALARRGVLATIPLGLAVSAATQVAAVAAIVTVAVAVDQRLGSARRTTSQPRI